MKILIIEQVRMMGEMIASGLRDETDVAQVQSVLTAEEALGILSANNIDTGSIDIVLISTYLPDGVPLTLVQTIRDEYPDVKSIVLGIMDTEAVILEYIQAGAAGYIFREESAESMIDSIRAAYNSRALVSPEIASAMMERLAELSMKLAEIEVDPSVVNELTDRETETLQLVARGLTNQEIGNEMHIETGTVKNHVHSILNKLDVNSREDAAAYFNLWMQSKEDQSNPD